MSDKKYSRKHVIDQNTFDDAVKENIEIFDMPSDEAIVSAREQFESQNIDLSNIIKDCHLYNGLANHPFVIKFNSCKDLIYSSNRSNEVIYILKELIVNINNDLAKKLYCGNNGGYQMIIDLMEQISTQTIEDNELTLTTLTFLRSIVNGYPDLLNINGISVLITLLRSNLHNQDIVICILDCIAHSIVLHETNRELWIKNNLLLELETLLNKNKSETILSNVLKIFRNMCLDDDIRVEISQTHERVRLISDQFLSNLTSMINVENKIHVNIQLLKTITALCVRNEYCTVIADNDIIKTLTTIFKTHYVDAEASDENIELLISIMGLLKAIVGNDDVKNLIYESEIIEMIMQIVYNYYDVKHVANIKLYETFLLLISTITLRHKPMCNKIYEFNILNIITTLMNKYINNVKIVKYGCWSLRNICTKNQACVNTVIELNGVDMFDKCLKLHKDIQFDIKNAMKQLGDEVNVQFDEQWTGKGQCNFNPEF